MRENTSAFTTDEGVEAACRACRQCSNFPESSEFGVSIVDACRFPFTAEDIGIVGCQRVSHNDLFSRETVVIVQSGIVFQSEHTCFTVDRSSAAIFRVPVATSLLQNTLEAKPGGIAPAP